MLLNFLRSVFLSLLMLFAMANPSNADNAEAIESNNKGVGFLGENKMEDAVRSFKRALELDSSYELALKNLAISYNNLAMEKTQEKSYEDALLLFEQALFVRPTDSVIRANVDGTLRILGHNPASAIDRAAVADMLMRRGATAGALMEYEAAIVLVPQVGKRPKKESVEQLKTLHVKAQKARDVLSTVEPVLLQIHLKQLTAGGNNPANGNSSSVTSGSSSNVFDTGSTPSQPTPTALDPSSTHK